MLHPPIANFRARAPNCAICMRRRGAKLPKQQVKKKSGCKVIPGHSENYRKSRIRGNRTKCNQNTNASRQKRARMHYKAHRQKTLSPMIYQDSSPKTAQRTLNHKWQCAPAENPRNTQVQKKRATKKKAPQNAREKKTLKKCPQNARNFRPKLLSNHDWTSSIKVVTNEPSRHASLCAKLPPRKTLIHLLLQQSPISPKKRTKFEALCGNASLQKIYEISKFKKNGLRTKTAFSAPEMHGKKITRKTSLKRREIHAKIGEQPRLASPY